MKRLYMGSCFKKYELDQLSIRILNQYDPDVMFYYGDFPYTEEDQASRWGYTTLSISDSYANNLNVEVYRDHHKQQRAMPYSKQVIARAKQFWYMWDDHEGPVEDAAKDLTWYQTNADRNGGLTWSGAAFGIDQTDLDAAWLASRTAAIENMTGNPASAVTDDTDAEYFSYVLGSVTYIVTDCIQYRSARDATDNASKLMLGPNQEAWVIDQVNNATTPFVCVFTKPLYQHNNLDTYYAYQTERDRMIGQFTKTGVCFLSGDQHYPTAAFGTINGVDILNVIGCPTSQTLNTQSGPIANENIWKWGGIHQNAAQPETRAAILVEDPENDEWIRIRLLSPMADRDHWQGYIAAGSNDVVYSI